MIKYRTGWMGAKIVKVEVERETESSIWIKGERHGKFTHWNKYFSSFDSAKDYLEEEARMKLASAKKQLDEARSYLDLVKKIKEEQS